MIREKYYWDQETGTSKCVLEDTRKNFKVTGVAHCHKEDLDMCNELTGSQIAGRKAEILYLKELRKEQEITVKSLKHIVCAIKTSKFHNPKSYESKMIFKQYEYAKEDLEDTIAAISMLKNSLAEYISYKEEFYQLIRKNRTKDKN